MLLAGDRAPEFELLDQSGEIVRLGDLRGRWVVLYFYPRDDTPGCTKEACSFRDHHAALSSAGAVVLGISPDKAATHRRFAEKHGLPFRLLVDTPDHATARAFGAWGPKTMYGHIREGITRSTFVIDPHGVVAKVWGKVKPDRHGEEVLEWLRSVPAGE